MQALKVDVAKSHATQLSALSNLASILTAVPHFLLPARLPNYVGNSATGMNGMDADCYENGQNKQAQASTRAPECAI